MNAQTMMDILDRNNQHGILLVHEKDGSVYEIIHLEENRFESTRIRFWFFDEKGELFDTSYAPAPNGEMDLLAEYADNLDTYGHDADTGLRVVWC